MGKGGEKGGICKSVNNKSKVKKKRIKGAWFSVVRKDKAKNGFVFKQMTVVKPLIEMESLF